MKKHQRLMSFLLAALMIGSSLVSCSEKSVDETQPTAQDTQAALAETEAPPDETVDPMFGGVQAALYFENVYISGILDCVNGGAFVGKLFGSGSATFKNCVSAVTLMDKPSSSGFVGVADPVDNNVMDPADPDETLTARVRMEDCAFYGTISSEKNAAFVGTVNGEVELKNCISAPVSGENRLCVNVDNTTVNSTDVIENTADLASLNWDGWKIAEELMLPVSVANLLAD